MVVQRPMLQPVLVTPEFVELAAPCWVGRLTCKGSCRLPAPLAVARQVGLLLYDYGSRENDLPRRTSGRTPAIAVPSLGRDTMRSNNRYEYVILAADADDAAERER